LNLSDLSPPVPVAIIGMGCMFPQANELAQYWANIRKGIDAITEVPESHWRVSDYFDQDPKAADRTYAHRGGFLTPVDFPLLEFGIAPHSVEATDTTQLLGLLVAKAALDDAGCLAHESLDRDRVSVILGVTGTLELVIPLGARLGHPIWRRRHHRRRRRANCCLLRRLAGKLVPRPPGQRRRRPNRQPARPARDQLRRRCRVRQLFGRGQPGHARAGRRALRPGRHRRA
jgi:Beta-ketoacyl synthase, N-terminal domain